MESVVNYLEDTEKKLIKEMAELFSKMREQRDTLSLQGIEDMYTYTPIEGVLYEPCVRIPGPGGYYCSEYKLPNDEYIIITRSSSHQHMSGQSYNGTTNKCIVLTNYGRCFIPKQIGGDQARGYSSHTPTNDNNQIHCYTNGYSSGITPIIKVDPLPYKMPECFIKAFKLGLSIGNIHDSSLHMDSGGGIHEVVLKTLSDTSASLQELNKEFYLFAGKWKPHMTECATLDVDKMRQTIIENAQSIEQLKANKESLEQQNKKLQAELKELKEQKATLEKEKTKLLPLEKYKDAVLEFMTTHVKCKKYKPIDSNIIDVFKQFHSDKVFMESWVYNDVINSKDELNEYRIYKKVKGEMVSSGIDNSSMARELRRY
jgi:regulator of replication initiation timing